MKLFIQLRRRVLSEDLICLKLLQNGYLHVADLRTDHMVIAG